MTLLEQTIDPAQLQFKPPVWAAFIVFAVVFIILQRTIDALFRRWKWSKRHTPPWKYLYYLIEFIVVTLLPFTGAFAAMCFTPQLPLVDKVSVPAHASFAHTYRDEINDAVADKLKGYDLGDCMTVSRKTSILCGGYSVDNIKAVHNGETVTLDPHIYYNRDSQLVTLTVENDK